MPTLYDNFSQVKQYIDQEIPDLTSYVTKTELANCSYVTSFDLPVIDESIVPKETSTYTLGDVDHLYNAAYISRVKVGNNSQMYNDGGGITFSVNNNNGIRIGGSTFYPKTNKGYSNGSSTNYWNSTYTSRVDLNTNIALTSDNSGLFITTAGNLKFSFDTDSFHPYGSTYSGALDLGTSTRTWRSTYTVNLYADNIHNFIWTGTSAEYAALSDYTTYQFYLVQES